MDLLQCKLPAKADEESSYGERFGATLDQVKFAHCPEDLEKEKEKKKKRKRKTNRKG